jgi:pimeloyl-ACP methyl ester carboxylesterase
MRTRRRRWSANTDVSLLKGETNLATARASNITAPTQFIAAKGRYAYRRFGAGSGLPLMCLQHFTGTLDDWDPAVTDPLAEGREVILFESAGIGRSSGKVPRNRRRHGRARAGVPRQPRPERMRRPRLLARRHGGQQMALNRPSIFRRMILVGTAPRGGDDIMHLEKPSLAKALGDPKLQGYAVLQKIFFAPTQASQAAGAGFIERLVQRKEDRKPASGAEIAQAQMAAFREWDRFSGERFADLKNIRQPVLVVNGIHDEMIPVGNSYWLSAYLPNAVLLTYPDSGHGSLFQCHESFTRQAAAFLTSKSAAAPY